MANIFGTMDDKTQFEVRCVSEVVINDIFKSLLDSEDVGEYLQDVSTRRIAAVGRVRVKVLIATITVDGTLLNTNLGRQPRLRRVLRRGGRQGRASRSRPKAATASVDTKEDDQFNEEIPSSE